MDRRTFGVLIVIAALAGCSGSGSWNPWEKNYGREPPRTPPGAKGYACERGQRLIVRFEADAQSAWVIYPDRQFRLNRVGSGSGEQFSNGRTTLRVNDDEAMLEEAGTVQFANCKLERASDKEK